MWIYIWDTEIKWIYLWDTPVKEVYLWDNKIRPTIPPYLCFTANTAGSTVRIIRYANPTSVNFEISTDGISWRDYVLPVQTVWNYYRWEIITLTNVWDKVYWRNKSETTTWFSTSNSAYYFFSMSWSINASWNIMFLLNKNWTATSVWNYWFFSLFQDASSLVTSPQLPATTVWQFSYQNMFANCTNLETLNKLPCILLNTQCYRAMFSGCSKIKLSTSKTWEYQTEYRIPISWTGTEGTNWGFQMFNGTWWTFASTPSINTTYYTSNTVV